MTTTRHRILVSFSLEEFGRVKSQAAQFKLSISEMLRRFALGNTLPDPSTFVGAAAIRDLLKVNADQARLGNLPKLAIDKGMTDGTERNPVSGRARDYEAKTWEQSFERYMVENKAPILKAVHLATTWRELHDGLADHGLMMRKRGAGLVIAEANGGKGRMKASRLDRSCSLAKLEDRLGPYQPPPERQRAKPPKRSYQPKPMTRHPGQNRLWKTYLQQKKPGFLGRVLHFRNWKDYLLAEAHKDALALVVILTYKELLHMLDEATTFQRRPYQVPKVARAAALKTWLSASAWASPATTWLNRGLDNMDLKADEAGRVLFPFRDDKGHIWAVRAMDGLGATCDVGSTDRSGLSHVIDPGGNLGGRQQPYGGTVIVTTDCMSAAVLHKDTDHPVVVVPHVAGLADMAVSIRKQHPASRIIIAVPAANRLATRAAALVNAELMQVDGLQAQAMIIARLASKGRPIEIPCWLVKRVGTGAGTL